MDLEKAKKEFQKYVEKFDQENDMIKRKIKHSYQVMDISTVIAIRMGLSKEEVDLATLIGLLHDIGRFYQAEKTQTFNDSNIDHSNYGVEYLFEKGHIREFLEDEKYDEIIRKAVLYHNDYFLPQKDENKEFTQQERIFSKLIRDADKIDIYRVYTENIYCSWSKGEISDSVLESFKKKECIKTQNKKTKSDTVMIVLAFLYDMNFPESFALLKEKGYFIDFVNHVQVDLKSKKEWEELTTFCEEYIERRSKDVR